MRKLHEEKCFTAADMRLSSSTPQCWSSHILSAMEGLTQSYLFKQKLLNCEPIDLSRFVMDLKDWHLEFWTTFSDGHPRGRNSKTLAYHQWCALSAQRALVTHPPYRLPRYMLLDLPRDVIHSVACFILRFHTLHFVTATWLSMFTLQGYLCSHAMQCEHRQACNVKQQLGIPPLPLLVTGWCFSFRDNEESVTGLFFGDLQQKWK